MSWVFFVILAILLWTMVGFIDKHVIGLRKHDPISATVLKSFILFAIFTTASLLAHKGISLNPHLVAWAIAGGVFTTFAIFLYYHSLLLADVTDVIPIFSIAPIFTLFLGAIFLNERFPWPIYIGITAISFGAMLLGVRAKEKRWTLSMATVLALGVALFSAMRSIAVKSPVESATVWPLLFWIGFGSLASATPMLIVYYARIKKYQRAQESTGTMQFVIADLFDGSANLAFVFALSLGPASLVAAIASVSPLLTFFVAVLFGMLMPSFVHEDLSRASLVKKMLAIFFIVCGTLIIALMR
jgi:uncharacterized membrane protein